MSVVVSFLLVAQTLAPAPPPAVPPPPTWIATSPVGAPKTFEVASVKVNHQAGPGGGFRYGPGFLIMNNSTLEGLVAWAYGVKDFQIVAPQPSFRSDRYDINAKARGAPDLPHLKLLLQALLAERFGLVVHRETRERPIFTLSVNGHGAKMQPAPGLVQPEPRLFGHGNVNRMEITGQHVTVAELTRYLNNWLSRPIVDKTSLPGHYNLHLAWTPDDSDPSGLSIFTAVKEQLGLKLESGKGPVEVLVIDSAQRTPTEN